ncbi:DNA-directed RNA polymerase [Polychytrium aggregatum]|uniref:DNA-directed RNA polymerase n=1 Tax=Polychytrium aggregatum TaxID=110093 RepID=UPI0022FEB5C1|nr:DNA-directed RNA polymerase [Polychytrium aggregatum]KAI9197420.1 DNA-directed RNA polymerase [Polychytrium aggregatum]
MHSRHHRYIADLHLRQTSCSQIQTDFEDPTSATFVIRDEDHTLGNALRWMVMKNPAVNYCGYAIPHPSEFKINFRIQTDGSITALDALNQGLDDLVAMAEHISSSFKQKVDEQTYTISEDALPVTW